MNRIFLSLCILVPALADAAPSLDSKQETVPDFLFLIDTSFSMSRARQSLTNTLASLILSGIQGRIRDGQTLGIWTFNEHLHSRRSPARVWSAAQGRAIASEAIAFVRDLRFEKQTRLDRVIPEITDAIRSAKWVTLLLLSDGDNQMRATPFDRSINLLYQEHGREVRKARQPFLTAFQVRNGTFVAWAVSVATGPINLPEIAETVSLPLKPVAPPLNPTPAPTTPPIVSPQSKAPVIETPLPASPVTPTLRNPESRPPAVASVPSPQPQTEAVATPPKPPNVAPRSPAPTTPSPDAALPESKPELVERSVPAAPNKVQSRNDSVTRRDETGPPTTALSSTSEKPIVPPAKLSKPRDATESVPKPNAAAAPIDTPKTDPVAEPPRSAVGTPTPPSSPSAPPQALAVVPEPHSNSTALLVSGTALFLVALGLIYWSLRMRRPHNRPSLISRSMDRVQK